MSSQEEFENDESGEWDDYDENEEEGIEYEDDDDLWFGTEEDIPQSTSPKEEKPKAEDFFTGSGSKGATDRLIKDLRGFQESNNDDMGVWAAPIGDNLYDWEVKFFAFEKGVPLEKDLQANKKKGGIDFVQLNCKFPQDYPFSPPFVRVVQPRFKFHTGHVTIGGSICMELLTTSGWLPTNDIESILIQIRSEMIVGGAELDPHNKQEYTQQEAQAAFDRVARQHGWEK